MLNVVFASILVGVTMLFCCCGVGSISKYADGDKAKRSDHVMLTLGLFILQITFSILMIHYTKRALDDMRS
jgi:hypothetical protein